jgi:FMN reductase
MPFVVGIAGAGSAETGVDVALLTVLRSAQVAGANTLFLGLQFLTKLQADRASGCDASLEHSRLKNAIAQADGLVLAGAAADGSLCAALTEALDRLRPTEGALPFHDKAVACIVAAKERRIAQWGLTSLRSAVHDFGGWPTPTGVAIDLSEHPFQATGTCSQPKVQAGLIQAGEQVVAFAMSQRAYSLGARHVAA